MFEITSHRGFHITLKNGITISTQFGAGNYCDNYRESILGTVDKFMQSENAEVAIWNKDGKWITKEVMSNLGEGINDDVIGHVDLEKWIKILNYCNKLE